MADVVVDDDQVTIALSPLEKVQALHGDVTVPPSSVVSARVVPDGMRELQGLRAPGTGFPGVIMVGTWRSRDGVTFAVCHGRRPALVLDLQDAPYDRIVVTVDEPDETLRRLTDA
jgi:hypothetical protein